MKRTLLSFLGLSALCAMLAAPANAASRDLTPFSEYKPAGENAPAANRAEPLVRAQWAKDAPAGISVCGEFVAGSSEPQAKILFSADRAVKDFKVLALAFESVDENGKVSFAVKELYRLDQLAPEHPLAVVTTFFATCPTTASLTSARTARRGTSPST
ncbi:MULTISPECIES: hypothetical protein [unclassified Pyramidobacter]|uniref:hypothetical protein n=1 Tax=unclassified Pyramidobacter TaxID=2632171 RepID=UPI000EA36752|nr:hypothetical protein [Pyramidobacter sp. CG50-2]RKJ79249.1 hypothetical protein D7D26_05335 [Pyramidobacter sp. CG50-2]